MFKHFLCRLFDHKPYYTLFGWICMRCNHAEKHPFQIYPRQEGLLKGLQLDCHAIDDQGVLTKEKIDEAFEYMCKNQEGIL